MFQPDGIYNQNTITKEKGPSIGLGADAKAQARI